MCRTGTAYDSMMAMYVGAPGGDCPCPDNPGTHAASFIEASDESCTFAPIGGPGFINVQAEADRCYVIRVGGWQPGDFKGIGAIDISCPGAFGGGEAPDPLAGDPSDADSGKNRYLSFSAPASATAGAAEEAIRITLDDVAGFGGFNGEVRFVGEPQEYTDEGLGTFIAAPLQCEPFFTDWSGFDLINVYGAEIVPGSSYTAQRADVSCSSLDDEGCFSTALTIETAKWGDVAPTYFAPGGPAQPDFGDISALVDKFTAAPTSPPKARAQLQPSVPKPQDAISFTDIANCIDAFTGAAFPYAGPSACP
jgi:hypothetical protein